jgi:small GTP-binding protein
VAGEEMTLHDSIPSARGSIPALPSSAPLGSSSGGYGVKAIRQLRNTNAAKQYHIPRPNLKRQQIIEKTYDYFLREVDPLVGDCVTYLLCMQPDNVPLVMLEYFTERKNGKKLIPSQQSKPDKASKSQKLFLATQISPILSKLVNRIATNRPTDVLSYLCEELQSLLQSSGPDTDTLSSQAKGKNQPTPTASGPKEIQILVLGAGSAGKTSFINALQGKFDDNVRPTIGFRPTNMLLGEDKVKFYDLGGGVKIRGIWPEYFHDVHAVVYLIDSTVRDEEAIQLFQSTIAHPTLQNKPLLMVANKQDIPGAMSADEIRSLYALSSTLHSSSTSTPPIYHIAETSSSCLSSSANGSDEPEVIDQEADPRVERSVEWLLQEIQRNYAELNHRVEGDTKLKQLEEQQKRMQRERKVLKNKILSAFVEQVDPAILAADSTLSPTANPEDVYTQEEGETFLANEIGEEVASLPPIALEVAGLVGYQRLALQMVGALKAPISKKKTPMDWDEIKALVVGIRSELGL